MPGPAFLVLASLIAALLALAVFLVYVAIRYSPIVGRIFEEKPLFLPLRVPRAENEGEEVQFKTDDGLLLAGTYLPARASHRIGVLVFCHEYLSDRWGVLPYADHLRTLGFDLFAFDFRNHGASESDPKYRPLQWVTDHEATDLRAALAYLRSRPDHDDAGYGLLGVSRGGGTALVVAADDVRAWGVITDGAFPTRGTMLAYILRWAEIYVGSPFLWKRMPHFVFAYLAWVGRICSQRRLHCSFPSVERAASRLAPRPWLMIHGAKDAYISTAIAERLFAEAREPKELWIVPKAKHNRCRELEPVAYADRVANFLGKFAPRRPLEAPASAATAAPKANPLKQLSSSGVF